MAGASPSKNFAACFRIRTFWAQNGQIYPHIKFSARKWGFRTRVTIKKARHMGLVHNWSETHVLQGLRLSTSQAAHGLGRSL